MAVYTPPKMPVSTIVLAVLTCIPFGLAIRDTVRGTYDGGLDDHDDDAEHDDWEADSPDDDYDYDALREYAAEQEREQEAARERYAGAFEQLIGKEPATLGSVFEDVHLGGSASQVEPIRAALAIYSRDHQIDVQPLHDTETLHTVYIKPPSEACDTLASLLDDRWGSRHADRTRQVWLDDGRGQRAVFEHDVDCELRFERYTPLARWLDTSRRSLVPMWAIGRPVKQLVETLGDGAQVTADEIHWTVPGIGHGSGTTQIRADVRKGKVVSLFVNVQADTATQDDVIAHVTDLVGKQPESEPLVWPVEPRVELQQGTSQFFLTIGRPPQD